MEIQESAFPDVHLVWDEDILIGVNTENEEIRFSDNGWAYKKQLEKIVKSKLAPYLTKRGKQSYELWQNTLGPTGWAAAECLLSKVKTKAGVAKPILDCDITDIAYLFTEICGIDDEDKLIRKYLNEYGVQVLLFDKADALPNAAWDTDPITGKEAAARGLLFEPDNQAVRLHFTKKMPETCIIPTSIDHIKITTIFSHMGPSSQQKAKKLIIPNTIKKIGNEAFSDCDNLISVEISEGVEEIGEYSFIGCVNLVSLRIPDSVETIGCAAFENCGRLKTLILPKHLKKISAALCLSCSALEQICIPETVTVIEDDSFSCCDKLEYIEIPQNVCEMRFPNFRSCFGLKKFCSKSPFYRVENDRYLVVNNDNCAIAFAPGMCTETEIPASITSLDFELFEGNYCIQSITFPKTITEIVNCSGCVALTSVHIEAPIETLPFACFYNCYNLEEVFFPKTLRKISQNAFKGCLSLLNVCLPDSLKEIDENAFSASGVKNINIPDSVTSLEEYVFSHCLNLEAVTIGKGVKTLKDSLFSNCLSLISVHFSDSVKKIESCCFFACKNLSLTVPDTVCEIENFSFNKVKHVEYHGNLDTSYWGCQHIN